VVAVWALGLVAVVGVALAGGRGDGEAVTAPSLAEASRASAAAPVVGTISKIDPPRSVIFLDSPATTDQVTTAEVVVRGDVRMDIAGIQVLLESSRGEPIVGRPVGPMSLDWHRDGPRRIPFVVALPLPDPRPSGPAVVQIVAFDDEGRVRGMFVRLIQIGARLDPTYGDATRRPSTGEDGLMGGITFGSNFGWRSDGR
jgi:hypothetical protein